MYNIYVWNKNIDEFIEKLKNYAPGGSAGKSKIVFSGQKYPYKVVLVFSLFSNLSIDKLFNNEINLKEQDNIIRDFYNILIKSYTFSKMIKGQKSKEKWFIEFDKKSVFSIIKQNPAKYLSCNFWEFKNISNILILHANYDKYELEKIRKHIIEICLKEIKTLMPEYSDFKTCCEISNFDIDHLCSNIEFYDDKTTEIKIRQYQHTFRQYIVSRDKNCLVCDTSEWELLEAAHIIPYDVCNSNQKFKRLKYASENGITLCILHHKMFDLGYFTFDDNWKLCYTNKLNELDDKMIINSFNYFYKNNNTYEGFKENLKYHNEIIKSKYSVEW